MTPTLLALSRSSAERSKTLLQQRFYAHGLSLLLSIATLFATGLWALVAVIAGLVAEGSAWVLRYRAKTWHTRSQEARRNSMIVDGLGLAREPTSAVDLRKSMSDEINRNAPQWEDQQYYATTAGTGPLRLKEMLEESAFWSKHLFKDSAYAMAITILVLIVAFFLLLLTSPLMEAPTGLAIVRVVALALFAFIGFDLLGQALDWHQASLAANAVDKDLQAMTSPTLEGLMIPLMDYFVATSSAVPIPTCLYRKSAKKLNKLWKDRCSTKTPQESKPR